MPVLNETRASADYKLQNENNSIDRRISWVGTDQYALYESEK